MSCRSRRRGALSGGRSGRRTGLSRLRRAWLSRSGRRRRRSGGRCLRCRLARRSLGGGGRSDRAGWRGLFLRQVGDRDFLRAIDRDSGNAFVLIDPCVRRKFLLAFFVQRLQLFHALFCARFFVITCARRWPDHREHDETEQNEETHNTEPCGEWRARVGNTAS